MKPDPLHQGAYKLEIVSTWLRGSRMVYTIKKVTESPVFNEC